MPTSSKSALVSLRSFVDVGDVVEDDEVELVKPLNRRFEGQVAARRLELLHQVGGSGVEDAVAALDEGEADSRGEMLLPVPGGPRTTML